MANIEELAIADGAHVTLSANQHDSSHTGLSHSDITITKLTTDGNGYVTGVTPGNEASSGETITLKYGGSTANITADSDIGQYILADSGTLTLTATNGQTVTLSTGDDHIIGGTGADSIIGGDGNDTFSGWRWE